jgi:hypothetical protein
VRRNPAESKARRRSPARPAAANAGAIKHAKRAIENDKLAPVKAQPTKSQQSHDAAKTTAESALKQTCVQATEKGRGVGRRRGGGGSGGRGRGTIIAGISGYAIATTDSGQHKVMRREVGVGDKMSDVRDQQPGSHTGVSEPGVLDWVYQAAPPQPLQAPPPGPAASCTRWRGALVSRRRMAAVEHPAAYLEVGEGHSGMHLTASDLALASGGQVSAPDCGFSPHQLSWLKSAPPLHSAVSWHALSQSPPVEEPGPLQVNGERRFGAAYEDEHTGAFADEGAHGICRVEAGAETPPRRLPGRRHEDGRVRRLGTRATLSELEQLDVQLEGARRLRLCLPAWHPYLTS